MPLKLVKRPKSPFWIVRGTVRGIRVEESTGTHERRIAEEIRAKREAELLTQAIFGRRATATFAHAALSYLEQGGSTRFIEAIIRYFGETPLARIDLVALDSAAKKLYPKVSAATRNRQFYTPAVAVMKHAAKRGWCSVLVIQRPKSGPARIRYLRLEEAERLIAACSEHMRPLVIFLFFTGARIGEALWMDWKQVDLQRGHVSFPKTKNGEARGVPLHPRVRAALTKLKHRDGEVFRRPDGQAYEPLKGGHDTSAGSRIKTGFAAACRRPGITDFHPHDCRHTWATWHYKNNRNLGALMKLGGWKSERMVLRYAHVNVEELAETIDKLPGGELGDTKLAKEITA
jgi:integrase